MVDSIKLCADVSGNVHYHDVWLEVLEQSRKRQEAFRQKTVSADLL